MAGSIVPTGKVGQDVQHQRRGRGQKTGFFPKIPHRQEHPGSQGQYEFQIALHPGCRRFFNHAVAQIIHKANNILVGNFAGVVLHPHLFRGITHGNGQYARLALQGVFNTQGAVGTIHSANLQRLVMKAVADFRPGIPGQAAHFFQGNQVGVVMQAELRFPVGFLHVYLMNPPVVLQALNQPLHTLVAFVLHPGQNHRYFQLQCFFHGQILLPLRFETQRQVFPGVYMISPNFKTIS